LLAAPAFAVKFERVVPCSAAGINKHDQLVFGNSGSLGAQYKRMKELTKACSLFKAAEHGADVCESEGFAWLRQSKGYGKLKNSQSTIYNTTCDDSIGVCETEVVVECLE
jgi:hypothetical protein